MSCNGSTFKMSASGLPTAVKAPSARLDYGFDLAADPWLAPGETITNVDWSQAHPATASPLVLEGESVAGGVIFVWVSGGDPGKDYHLKATFTTSANRVDSRTLILQIRER